MHPRQRIIDLAIRHFTLPARDTLTLESEVACQIVTPSVRNGPLNAVTRFSFEGPGLEDLVQRTLEPYRRNGSACLWIVGPGSRPEGLGRILEKQGFRLDHLAYGLLRPTRLASPEVAEEITVERVTHETLDDYLFAARGGAAPDDELRAHFTEALAREPGRLECYLARYRGEPAGTSILRRLSPETGSLGSSMVLPGLRMRGIYKSLLGARLRRLNELGVPFAAVLAKQDTSGPICLRLGFEKVCELAIYVSS